MLVGARVSEILKVIFSLSFSHDWCHIVFEGVKVHKLSEGSLIFSSLGARSTASMFVRLPSYRPTRTKANECSAGSEVKNQGTNSASGKNFFKVHTYSTNP